MMLALRAMRVFAAKMLSLFCGSSASRRFSRPSLVGRSARCHRLVRGIRQEAGQRGRVEVEHLRASQLAVADPIQSKDGAVEASARRTQPPLPPENHDLLFRCGHDPRIHPSLGLGGLERNPRLGPVGALASRTV